MTPADIARVFGRDRLRMVTGAHVEVFREPSLPGERRRYTKRFLDTAAGDFRHWTEREWRILARLFGHGIGAVPEVVKFDRGAADRPALVQTYDAGITVDHWATLLPVHRAGRHQRHVFEDCAHWWALARHCLIALDAIHELHVVHLDLKADNVCIPFGPVDFDPHAVALAHPDADAQPLSPRFEQIALIDFAFSLVSGESLTRALPIARQTEYDYQSPRLLHALEAGSRGDLLPTRQLDWRCDVYSLAAMLRRYLPDPESALAGGWTRPRHTQARALVRKLLEAHDGERPALRPHAELIALASAALLDDELSASLAAGWTLAIDSPATGADSPTPVTRIALPVSVDSVDNVDNRIDLPALARLAQAQQSRARVRRWAVVAAAVSVAAVGAPLLYGAWSAPGGREPVDIAAFWPGPAGLPPPSAGPARPASDPVAAAPVLPAAAAASAAVAEDAALRPDAVAAPPAQAASVLAPTAVAVAAAASASASSISSAPASAAQAAPALAPAPAPAPEPAPATTVLATTPEPVRDPVVDRVPIAAAGAAPVAEPAKALPRVAPRGVKAPAAAAKARPVVTAAQRKPPAPSAQRVLANAAPPMSERARALAWLTARGPSPRSSTGALQGAWPAVALMAVSPPMVPRLAAGIAQSPAAAGRGVAVAAPVASVGVAAAVPAAVAPSMPTAAPIQTIAAPTLPRPPEAERSPRAQDYAARAAELLATDLPRYTQRAERRILRVLQLAAVAGGASQDEDVRRAAGALRDTGGELLASVTVAADDAMLLHESAQHAFWRRGSAREAIELQTKAFAANPFDAEVAGSLAFLSLKLGPERAEVARQLALYALTLPQAGRATSRVEQWTTLAIASALAGRDSDARNAWFVSLALAPQPERQCRAAINAYTAHGEPLRAPVEAMLYRAHASGRAQGSLLCEWPPHWMASRSGR